MARFDELQADKLVRDHTTGMYCGTVAKSTVTGKKIVRDEAWARWRK